jgi:hypothetical protein
MKLLSLHRRPDLSTLRPWKAEPEDSTWPDGPWRVVAPAKYGHGYQLVACHLSEDDARIIAAAPHMEESLEEISTGDFSSQAMRELADTALEQDVTQEGV